jgi:hypothetical protein
MPLLDIMKVFGIKGLSGGPIATPFKDKKSSG